MTEQCCVRLGSAQCLQIIEVPRKSVCNVRSNKLAPMYSRVNDITLEHKTANPAMRQGL